MKIASVAEIKAQFSAFLKSSENGPVVVTRNGKPVAVIVGVADEDEIERLLMAYSPRLQAMLEESRKQIRAGDVLGHEEFWAAVEASRGSKRAPQAKSRKSRIGGAAFRLRTRGNVSNVTTTAPPTEGASGTHSRTRCPANPGVAARNGHPARTLLQTLASSLGWGRNQDVSTHFGTRNRRSNPAFQAVCLDSR